MQIYVIRFKSFKSVIRPKPLEKIPKINQHRGTFISDSRVRKILSTVNSRFKKVHFSFLNQWLFDLRKIYVVNLKTDRPKKNALCR